MALELTVTAAELPNLVNLIPPRVKWLSLDCFDTLLWRNCVAPRDVFADLDVPGGAMWMRAKSEARARQHAWFDRGKAEVTIEQIYRAMMPAASDDDVVAAARAEIEAEVRHCYGFAPTVALMRAAKARGLKIMIVSDTYLSEDQLRELIGRAAGENVAALIDRIFVSCAFGDGKAEGMFKPVLARLNCGVEAIFHVGDNKTADQIAPAKLGIATAHLKQFHDATAQRLRFEVSAGSMIDQRVRTDRPAFAPHRAALSLHGSDDPVHALGHDVLGPVMHAFAQWVRAEQAEMAARLGKEVKLLFLMRDGHLPMTVYRALFGADQGAPVEISRFVARRASFTDGRAVHDYLASETIHGRTEVLSRQLGLTDVEGAKLSGNKIGFDAQKAFNKAAMLPANVAKIVQRSGAFADTLMAHLQRAGVERGDAVMFVDLGYAGSVQTMVEPVLRDRFDLTVAGRYLLFRDHEQTGFDKKGLIDARHYDNAAVHALCMPVAVIEQLSTIAEGSVVGYEPDGTPVRKKAGQKGLQNKVRDAVQAACLDFATHADDAVVRPPLSDDADCRRHMAAAVLARFLFMPTAGEVEVLKAFDHDVNLGTDDMVALVDPDSAGEGLRRAGLFYINKTDRMFLPGELQPQGMAQMLTLFAASRHQFDFRPADFHAGTIALQAFLADGISQTMLAVEAQATHDGYYQAVIPIGAGRFAAGVQFGPLAEWLQIEEVMFHDVRGLHDANAAALHPPVAGQYLCDDMTEEAAGFYRCGETGLLLVPPPAAAKRPMLLSIIFRPIVRRATRALLKEAA